MDQTLVQGNREIASQLAEAATLTECKAGASIIAQDGGDNDLYLIVAGQFSIDVNGREVARRTAGQHVGEMALIDPKAKRSASVTALETSVVAKVTEPRFSALASQHPELWRSLARELGDRLTSLSPGWCPQVAPQYHHIKPRQNHGWFFVVRA